MRSPRALAASTTNRTLTKWSVIKRYTVTVGHDHRIGVSVAPDCFLTSFSVSWRP